MGVWRLRLSILLSRHKKNADVLRGIASGHPMVFSPQATVSVAYSGLIASVLGFTCWNMGVMRIGVKTAGYFGNLYPISVPRLAFFAALISRRRDNSDPR
jgi:hypothetical protein